MLTQKKLQFEDLAEDYIGRGSVEQDPQTDESSNNILEQFRDKPFYCWDINKKGFDTCCFNHLVGLPMKKGKEHPIYDYEQEILDAVRNNQHVWCKKARGIGFTTFMIRYLAWLCVKDDLLAGQSIFITTGTEHGFAKELKDKIGELFVKHFPHFKPIVKYNDLYLNKTRFRTFPSRNLKDMRGYTDVAFIFIDEADYFDVSQQEEIGAVIRSYEEKSDCKIIMVSTANRPDGLFHAIENGEQFRGFFYKLLLLVKKGLDKIFDRKQIDKIKRDNPDYLREYEGMYIGRIGNIFAGLVEGCATLGDSIPNDGPNPYSSYCVGVDFGFNVSKSVIVVGEWKNDIQKLRVVKLVDFNAKPTTPSRVAERMWDIYQEYGPNTHFFIDGSNAGAVNEIKVKFGEGLLWRENYKKGISKSDRIHPINFGTEHKEMLRQMYMMVAEGILGVPSVYDKLLIAMRTAQATDFDLDKEETVNDDYLDACRLMCYVIRYKQK